MMMIGNADLGGGDLSVSLGSMGFSVLASVPRSLPSPLSASLWLLVVPSLGCPSRSCGSAQDALLSR